MSQAWRADRPHSFCAIWGPKKKSTGNCNLNTGTLQYITAYKIFNMKRFGTMTPRTTGCLLLYDTNLLLLALHHEALLDAALLVLEVDVEL